MPPLALDSPYKAIFCARTLYGQQGEMPLTSKIQVHGTALSLGVPHFHVIHVLPQWQVSLQDYPQRVIKHVLAFGHEIGHITTHVSSQSRRLWGSAAFFVVFLSSSTPYRASRAPPHRLSGTERMYLRSFVWMSKSNHPPSLASWMGSAKAKANGDHGRLAAAGR